MLFVVYIITWTLLSYMTVIINTDSHTGRRRLNLQFQSQSQSQLVHSTASHDHATVCH